MIKRTVFGVAVACITAISCLSAPVAAQDKTIYLTFDDGPLTGTENILNVLETENVPATMFMVGMHAEASATHKSLVERAKAMSLVTVGNHSYSHAHDLYRHFYSDTDAVVADMKRANKVLGLTTEPIRARLPGRDVFRLPDITKDDLSIGKMEDGREEPDFDFTAADGFYLYGWDHEWVHDSRGKPVQTVDLLVNEIDHLFTAARFVRPNKLILLMHDEMFQDGYDGEANLRDLIQKLKQNGYAFGAIQTYDG
ncbi:polysaccharide deacetylase family protein [Brucella cytisi]|uniref:Chitooligosaccharide deacetylase n=1 Tax=Brucella cytisi TaxID=407152 RepID=A0A1J6I766_9HYPH|nr:polysaccharide deacetylase family protein [Brucella cytisi]OIS90808.1 polysaccharide deacetylase [Brucella cytisi]